MYSNAIFVDVSIAEICVSDYTFRNSVSQVLVKHGALIAISNKYGDMPLTKARPRLRKKLEGK